MKLGEIIDYLESIAPPGLQENYDNSGLLIGSRETDIGAALICLDSTEEVITEAMEKGCNLVIAHHPLIFRGLKQITQSNYVERAVRLAIKNDMQLYAIHTNLDNVLSRGVNGMIAQRLGLKEIEVLQPKSHYEGGSEWKADKTGSGLLGVLEDAMSESSFLQHVKERMQLKLIRHTPLSGRQVKEVAVCGGSGSFLTETAKSREADVFITADVKYHDFFDADGKILIADIGHYESEQFTIDLLHDLLREKFPNFAALKAETVTNPLNYYT